METSISIRIYKKFSKILSGKGLHKIKILNKLNKWFVRQIQTDYTLYQGFGMYLGKDTISGKNERRYSIQEIDEPLERMMVEKHVKLDDYVVDIGANIGIYTLLLSKYVGKNGKIFSFEPEPESFEILKKNILENNIENSKLENLAVSNTNDKVKLFLNEVSGTHTIFKQTTHKTTGEYVDVCAITLDDYFLEKKLLDKISFVKIDVEGVEFNVLKGMTKILEKNERISLLIEVIPNQLLDFGTDPNDLLDFLIQRRFSIYLFDYNKLETRKLNSIEDLQRENGVSVNIFCKRENQNNSS